MKSIFKNFVLASLFALVTVTFFSCSAKDELAPASVNTRSSITVSGVITGTNNWSGTVYLDGKVFVVNGTLNIAAGTEIIGLHKDSTTLASALIVTKTGTINAVGNASNPIVFKGESNTKGSWGGLVLLGTAAINQSSAQIIEGITSAQAGGNDITYGTPANGLSQTQVDAINNVSSGRLSYVRVEYAGASIATDNELNSFTFGGVGSLTQLDHLQAYYGADDAFEWFGGAANAKYLVAVGADDDSFDFDFGYTGKLQFLVSVIDPAQSYSANPNGIESDNNATGVNVTPYTHPVISNITIAGTSTGNVTGGAVGSTHALLYAAHLRRYSGATIVNGIFYGFPSGIVNNGGNTSAITLNTNVGTATSSSNTYVGSFSSASTNNVTVANAASLILASPFGTFEGGTSFKLGGLTASGSPANEDPYDATALGTFFDAPYSLGGALDATGSQWLAASWVK